MSELPEQAADATDGAHRYGGAIGIGEPHHRNEAGEPAVLRDLSPAEREHNGRMFGETWRERTGRTIHDQRRAHSRCVAFCRDPGQRRRGVRCPSCYGDVDVRGIEEEQIEPCPTRAERFAAWAGGWVAAFCEAVMFPFHVGRAHTEALVRDTIQQAMEAGLQAEIPALADMLTVLEGIEGELRAIRNAAELAGERT